eukprot:1157941-Pelagomonas_calceolata.AAC.2
MGDANKGFIMSTLWRWIMKKRTEQFMQTLTHSMHLLTSFVRKRECIGPKRHDPFSKKSKKSQRARLTCKCAHTL